MGAIARLLILMMGKFLFIGLLMFASPVYAADIDVVITGLKNNHGQVLVSLYDHAKAFPADTTKAFNTIIVPIKKQAAQAKFKAIPKGIYAIAVVHDENGNGKLDTNFFGIPKEGVGVSNHARGHMGPPSFQDASFTLKEAEKQAIQIHY